MTKKYFIELANFNIWANNIVISWLEQINDDQWTQEIESSFNTIRETVLHIASAESAWYERMIKNKNIEWFQKSFTGNKQEVIELWKTKSQNILDFLNEFDETRMNEILAFTRLNGEKQTMPYFQIFAHVLNHSTYHRGQIVTMLRQSGFTNVSSTDLLGYYRTLNV